MRQVLIEVKLDTRSSQIPFPPLNILSTEHPRRTDLASGGVLNLDQNQVGMNLPDDVAWGTEGLLHNVKDGYLEAIVRTVRLCCRNRTTRT